MISSARRDLPAPASPMIDTTPLWPLRTSCTAAVEQRPLVVAADERDVAAHRADAGRVGAGDQPGLLVLLAPAQAGDAEAARGGWTAGTGRSVADAGEHAAGRRQRLQPGGRVHDVAHRRVVRAGEDADEHLAGVDADAHAQLGRRRSRLDVAGQRVLHPQRRPARPARRRPRGRPGRRTGRRWRRRAACRRGRRTARCRRRGARSTPPPGASPARGRGARRATCSRRGRRTGR